MDFSVDDLRGTGFTGFAPLRALNTSDVPATGGVYVVLRAATDPPSFTGVSTGGHFKGKNPSVPTATLISKWVNGPPTVYIGKATNLRQRLRQYRDFGNGRTVGHWGGRYIWQLEDCDTLLVCWKPAAEPRATESILLAEFASQYGRFPFANLSA
jgi:hypothetical protein